MYKVMIIDDEETIREGLRTVINWEEHNCTIIGEAEDGDEGVKLIISQKPDIIITDVRMPGLNGLEMISKIKELHYQCVIVLLTGFREFEYAQQAVRLGAFRLILKPTNTNELLQIIDDAVAELRKQATDQNEILNIRTKLKEFYGITQAAKDNPLTLEGPLTKSRYLVAKSIEILKANYYKELDLKSVSDQLYISTWHLSKLLKKETGSNFIDILNEIRIEESKKLLLSPQFKIYEVAEKIGYNDVPYFTKLFKKHTGQTPMEFKNGMKIEQTK
jgi:two-component system, response regulator YesN